MRVGDGDLTGAQPAKPGRAYEAAEVDRGAEPRSREPQPAGGDQVELSGLAGRLAQALEAAATQRAARVEQLARQYADGRYQVDAAALSRVLVRQMHAESGQASGGAP